MSSFQREESRFAERCAPTPLVPLPKGIVQGNVVHGQQAIRRRGPIWSFQLGGGEMELSIVIRAGDREATDSKRPNQIALTPVNASDTP